MIDSKNNYNDYILLKQTYFLCIVYLDAITSLLWLKHLWHVLQWGILCDYILKGADGAQASHESSSDAGFDETMDLSFGKDKHSVTRYCYKREKLVTFVFVVQIWVLVWDTLGLYAGINLTWEVVK